MTRAMVVAAMLAVVGCGGASDRCPEGGHVVLGADDGQATEWYFDCSSPAVYLGRCVVGESATQCWDAQGVAQSSYETADAQWRAACVCD